MRRGFDGRKLGHFFWAPATARWAPSYPRPRNKARIWPMLPAAPGSPHRVCAPVPPPRTGVPAPKVMPGCPWGSPVRPGDKERKAAGYAPQLRWDSRAVALLGLQSARFLLQRRLHSSRAPNWSFPSQCQQYTLRPSRFPLWKDQVTALYPNGRAFGPSCLLRFLRNLDLGRRHDRPAHALG